MTENPPKTTVLSGMFGRCLRRVATIGVLMGAIQLPATARDIVIPEPVPPPAAVRGAFDLSPFYRQWIDVEGMPVVASARVDPNEFSHAIHLMGLNTVDSSFESRLAKAYDEARRKGLWSDTYAITNKEEYWAEGVQSWFDTNREHDSEHNHVNTRGELNRYDPALATLLVEIFGDTEWRYTPATERTHLLHLQGSFS